MAAICLFRWMQKIVTVIAVALTAPLSCNAAASSSSILPVSSNIGTKRNTILVIGSANVDTFLPVTRFPIDGENLTTRGPPSVDVPGGKGCTQAVAVSKLVKDQEISITRFVAQLGLLDATAGSVLQSTLQEHRIDHSQCGWHPDLPCGRGYVFLTDSGSVSAIVSEGSNQYGWEGWKKAWDDRQSSIPAELETKLHSVLEGVQCILLQREVPEYVNLLIASWAKQMDPSVVVFQDVGGEDRPISSSMLHLCDYLVPNESELKRLVESSCSHVDSSQCANDDEKIMVYVRALQQLGARHVLVTRGSKGSTLVTADGLVLRQPAIRLPPGTVVDETGAGDCFRAAFCVALMEGHELKQCMLFATAAGSCAVQVHGAVPSTPSRSRVLDRMAEWTVLDVPRGDGQQPHSPEQPPRTLYPSRPVFLPRSHSKDTSENDNGIPRGGSTPRISDTDNWDFPFMFGSRLNSMKDRPELWGGKTLESPFDFVQRQATVRGLTCVDFNYPQHFGSHWTSQEAKSALDNAGLKAGAVCLRYPSIFARGAMNHPDHGMRRDAVEITKKAAEVALELGTNEVVIWSAFDGYDYPFQVDYDEKWDQLVTAFQELCDTFPSVKFSLEYKPTDENTRFFTIPTTGAALLFVEEVNRPNMGLTLDVGHMLMAGENPGQSIAMVGRKRKLFGIQLNDGFTRLAAEDGLIFGSVHPSMALEIMYQLRRTNFCGHFYFDTFPQRSDPIQEAEYNIRQAKRFWNAASSIDSSLLRRITDEHDALGALEMIEDVLRNVPEHKTTIY